jgi:GAF domain-containing protein
MLEHLKELIITIISLIGSLAAIYLKHLIDVKKANTVHKDPVIVSIEEQELIYGRLVEVMDRLYADRVYIIQFHTGNLFQSNKKMQSYSITHEVVAAGTSRYIPYGQSILLSQYYSTFQKVLKENRAFYPDVEKMEEIDATKATLIGRGIQSYYGVIIRDLNENVIGMLIVNFVHKKYEMTEDEFKLLQHDADSISGYLFIK